MSIRYIPKDLTVQNIIVSAELVIIDSNDDRGYFQVQQYLNFNVIGNQFQSDYANQQALAKYNPLHLSQQQRQKSLVYKQNQAVQPTTPAPAKVKLVWFCELFTLSTLELIFNANIPLKYAPIQRCQQSCERKRPLIGVSCNKV
ncbi:hypothetical protein ABPG72_012302 [Tetrahymena utriculariae]